VIQTLQEYSPEDMPFTTEEEFDQIEWPKKEEYQQLLDQFQNKEVGTVKILKRPKCYPRYLGITRRSCLEAHMVLDMEYREQERLEHGPGGPIFLLLSQLCPVSSTSLHHYRPGLASERTLAP
jgi:hypothetical protein